MAVILEHHTPKGGHGFAGDGTLERSATHTVQLTGKGRLKLPKQRSPRAWDSFGQLEQASSSSGRWTQKGGAEDIASQTDSRPSEPQDTKETPEDRRERILKRLEEHPEEVGNLAALAKALGISRSTLYRDKIALEELGLWPE